MTPNMYGYARLPGVQCLQLLPVRSKLSEFAQGNGFELAEVFVFLRPGEALGAWRELVAHARANGVQNVVVPTLADLHPAEGTARVLRDSLADLIGGQVWVADEQPSEAEAGPPGQPEVMSP
jgi:hypothetical protein